MENGEFLGVGGTAQAHPFLPARMSEAAIARHLLLDEGRVIDDEVGMIDEPQHILIELARHMLSVGDVAGTFALKFDAIADRAVGMVEACGIYDNTIVRLEHIAR